MELRIYDIKGKELGTIQLNDEVVEVLKTTGVSLMFDYDITKNENSVIAYLH